MTIDELKERLQTQLEQAEAAEDTARATLHRAELRSAFVRGQLAALSMINIDRPTYQEGEDAPATFLQA